jgi:hypothetical protein
MKLKSIIGNHSFWMINKALYKRLGWNATLLLQHLVDIEEEYFYGMSEFYQQVSRISLDIDLSEYEIRNAKKVLLDADLISIVKKGIPAKDHFKLHKDNILKIFTSTGLKSEPLDIKGLNDKDKESKNTNNLYQTNNIENKESTSLDSLDAYAEEEEQKFISLFEKVEEVCLSHGLKIGNRESALSSFYKIGEEVAEGFMHRLKNDHTFKPTSLEDFLYDEAIDRMGQATL